MSALLIGAAKADEPHVSAGYSDSSFRKDCRAISVIRVSPCVRRNNRSPPKDALLPASSPPVHQGPLPADGDGSGPKGPDGRGLLKGRVSRKLARWSFGIGLLTTADLMKILLQSYVYIKKWLISRARAPLPGRGFAAAMLQLPRGPPGLTAPIFTSSEYLPIEPSNGLE